MTDDLKQLAEDAYLLASNFHTGNDEFLVEAIQAGGVNPDVIDAIREWRVVELIVALGDRACALAGLNPKEDVWVPEDLKDLVG